MAEALDPLGSSAGDDFEELLAWLLEREVEVEVILGEKKVPNEILDRDGDCGRAPRSTRNLYRSLAPHR